MSAPHLLFLFIISDRLPVSVHKWICHVLYSELGVELQEIFQVDVAKTFTTVLTMQFIQEQTGLNSTKQIGIGAITLGLLYLGTSLIRNHIPSERSLKKLNVVIIGASRG